MEWEVALVIAAIVGMSVFGVVIRLGTRWVLQGPDVTRTGRPWWRG